MDGEGPRPCYSKWSTGQQHRITWTFVGTSPNIQPDPQTHQARICIYKTPRFEKPCSSTFCLRVHRSLQLCPAGCGLVLMGRLQLQGLGSKSSRPQEALRSCPDPTANCLLTARRDVPLPLDCFRSGCIASNFIFKNVRDESTAAPSS